MWTVTEFTFTGAAVLRREKAAYPQTWMKLSMATAGRRRQADRLPRMIRGA